MKKRWIISCASMLVGILVMLLLPWEYVLCDCEYYRLVQTPFGGSLTIKDYDRLIQVDSPDCEAAGVVHHSVEKLFNELLSGEGGFWNMYYLAQNHKQPKLSFPGLSKIYVPRLPQGFRSTTPVTFTGMGMLYKFTSADFVGDMSVCEYGNCVNCMRAALSAEKAKKYPKTYNLSQYGKWTVVTDPLGDHYASGMVDGIYCTIRLGTRGDAVLTEELLNQFKVEPYFSSNPTLIAAYWSNIGSLTGAALILSGAALAIGNLVKVRKKRKEQKCALK